MRTFIDEILITAKLMKVDVEMFTDNNSTNTAVLKYSDAKPPLLNLVNVVTIMESNYIH